MSELKATTAQEIVRNEKDCDYMDELFGGVKMPPTQVYLKSEADKVIAELEEKINEAQTELELWRDGSIISEAQHQFFPQPKNLGTWLNNLCWQSEQEKPRVSQAVGNLSQSQRLLMQMENI